MKPQPYLVPRDISIPHLSRHHTLPNFGTTWHYHPEIEIHYIIRGEGVRFVGDNVANFDSGELLLLGANLPHMWRCDPRYFKQDPDITAEAVVVQFLPEFIGQDFLQRSESLPILSLFEKAQAGLIVSGETREKVIPFMYRTVGTTGLKRMVAILSILEVLSESNDLKPISKKNSYQSSKEETGRLNNIYNYTLENYQDEITLDEIAKVANLSVTSFCRYFKKITKKTFFVFLIEIRISHAKRLLIENPNITTEALCFECGYNNKSNFYTHFKKLTGLTPKEYKRKCNVGN